MKKILKNWHRYLSLIGIILFVYILSKIDYNQFWLVLKQARFYILVFLPFFLISVFLLQTLKWQKLLKIQGLNYKFWYLFKVHLVSHFYAVLTPSHLGYFVKVGYLNDAYGAASASVVVDRILDIISLIIFASIGAFLLIGRFPNLFFQLLAFALIFIVLVLFFYSQRRAKFFFTFFKRIIPVKFHQSLKKIFYDFYNNLPKQKKLLIPFLLTLLTWFLIYTQGYIIALCLNLPIPFLRYIFYFPIASAVGMIPITIAGLGTREATLILVFSQFSISVEAIIALSLTAVILTNYLPAFCGLCLSFYLKKINE